MNLDDLLLNLAERRVRVLLDGSGSSLRVRGENLSDDLMARIKVHKAGIIAALQEARSTAIDLFRDGDADEFERELHDAKAAGSLSIADWCAGLLAIKTARRWQAERTNDALAA